MVRAYHVEDEALATLYAAIRGCEVQQDGGRGVEPRSHRVLLDVPKALPARIVHRRSRLARELRENAVVL